MSCCHQPRSSASERRHSCCLHIPTWRNTRCGWVAVSSLATQLVPNRTRAHCTDCAQRLVPLRRAVVGKAGESLKNVASSITPSSGPNCHAPQASSRSRPAEVVREESPDVQLRTAVRGAKDIELEVVLL